MEEKKQKKKIEGMVELPEGISASYDGSILTLKNNDKELSREFKQPYISIEIKDKNIIFNALRQTKREKKVIGSNVAHVKNMIKGITEGHKYVLKVCSGHFPMNVSVKDQDFIIKNFLGEKTPRILKIKRGATVKVEGDEVVVESNEKEVAGQVSADIEQLTRRTGYDTRIFQDGIWICNKDGKEIK